MHVGRENVSCRVLSFLEGMTRRFCSVMEQNTARSGREITKGPEAQVSPTLVPAIHGTLKELG